MPTGAGPLLFADKKAVAQAILAAFLFPWVFDVRAAAGFDVGWLVYVQLLSFLASTGVFLLSLRIFKLRIDLGPLAGNALNVAVCAIFVAVSLFSGIVEHNDLMKVFAGEIPTILFIYSLVIVAIIAQAGLKPEDVLEIVAVAAVAAILVRIPVIAALYGIDFNTVRFQILCGATPIGSAYILSRLPPGFRVRDWAFTFVQTVIILVSVTRTEILVFAGMAAALFPFMARRLLRPSAILGIATTVVVLVASIYALGTLIPGSPLDRWMNRTASYQTGDVDFSGLDRESQALYQLQQLSDAGIEKYIGFGIAARGGNYAPIEAYELARGIGKGGLYVPTGFADETYISLIFLGGVIGGGPLLLAQFVWFWNSLRSIPFILKTYPRKLTWVVIAPLAVVGLQVTNILGASFGDRGQSVFFGLCLGTVGWITALRRRRRLAAGHAAGFVAST